MPPSSEAAELEAKLDCGQRWLVRPPAHLPDLRLEAPVLRRARRAQLRWRRILHSSVAREIGWQPLFAT